MRTSFSRGLQKVELDAMLAKLWKDQRCRPEKMRQKFPSVGLDGG